MASTPRWGRLVRLCEWLRTHLFVMSSKQETELLCHCIAIWNHTHVACQFSLVYILTFLLTCKVLVLLEQNLDTLLKAPVYADEDRFAHDSNRAWSSAKDTCWQQGSALYYVLYFEAMMCTGWVREHHEHTGTFPLYSHKKKKSASEH